MNWRQVQATHRALGGEGTLILQLVPEGPVSVGVLHGAIGDAPFPVGEGPADGSWIEAPKGWLLVVQADPGPLLQRWIGQLAANLTAEGVSGSLTGARGVGRVAWAKELQDKTPTLSGMLAYQPLPSATMYGFGWGADPAVLEAVLDHTLAWALADADLARVWMNGVNIPVEPSAARPLFRRAVEASCSLSGYSRAKYRVRFERFRSPAAVSLSQYGYSTRNWQELVEDLRQQVLTAPRDRLVLARVDAYDWSDILLAFRDRTAHDGHSLNLYPDLWGEWSPDPCGIQILTSAHLAKAHDLSDWTITGLGDDRHLVEARNLADWYAQPPSRIYYRDPGFMAKPRADFGDMILTRQRAADLGLTTRPLRHTLQPEDD